MRASLLGRCVVLLRGWRHIEHKRSAEWLSIAAILRSFPNVRSSLGDQAVTSHISSFLHNWRGESTTLTSHRTGTPNCQPSVMPPRPASGHTSTRGQLYFRSEQTKEVRAGAVLLLAVARGTGIWQRVIEGSAGKCGILILHFEKLQKTPDTSQ